MLIAGNPNAGKTTLFNLLTGASAKVGNYPGVTVDRRAAKLTLAGGRVVEIIDLPGTYSLTSRSAEEKVSVDTILGDALRGSTERSPPPNAIVVVVDATALRRGLYLTTQVLGTGVPVVLCLNMMDEAKDAGIEIDRARLGEELGCAVVGMVARKGVGKTELLDAIAAALEAPPRTTKGPEPAGTAALEADLLALESAIVDAVGERSPLELRTLAIWALLSLGDDELDGIPEGVRSAVMERRAEAEASGRRLEEEIIEARYARIDDTLKRTLKEPRVKKRGVSDRIDSVLVHPVYGLATFLAVMALVFQTLFSWAEPLMKLVEEGTNALKSFVIASMAAGAFRDLLVQGVISGVGNVLVFVPQIALLFVFITVLEDSGYLARVAFVIDRVMGGVGLNGKAFVPMLSGFACAIPAVMATRTIESRRDRLLTMLVVPLTSCSARLPVYVLVAGTVFTSQSRVLGIFSAGALALFSMYALSIVSAIGAAYVLRRTVLKGPKPSLVLELPPYRLPSIRNVLTSTWQRVRRFLIDAGTVILALTIALWAFLTYPKDASIHDRYEGERVSAEAIVEEADRTAELTRIDHAEAGEELRHSLGGRVGTVLEPVLRPLGFDYRIGVGILGAFAAREVFVSTLGIVFDVGDTDEKDESLRDALRQARHPDGSKVFTPLVGISLMVFFVLACQCMSTLAVVRRESGSWKYPALLFGYMTVLAYVVTLIVYQGGRALGLGGG